MSPITLTIPSQVERETLFKRLYLECFPAVARLVKRSGGDLETARDVFQEALLCYYEKVVLEECMPRKGEKAYLVGIARNLFLKGLEKRAKTEPLGRREIVEQVNKEPIPEKLMAYLEQAGKKCMDLLTAFYYQKLNMKAMAVRFGYASERSATVQKYKCLEKVRNTIKEKALDYEDFTD